MVDVSTFDQAVSEAAASAEARYVEALAAAVDGMNAEAAAKLLELGRAAGLPVEAIKADVAGVSELLKLRQQLARVDVDGAKAEADRLAPAREAAEKAFLEAQAAVQRAIAASVSAANLYQHAVQERSSTQQKIQNALTARPRVAKALGS